MHLRPLAALMASAALLTAQPAHSASSLADSAATALSSNPELQSRLRAFYASRYERDAAASEWLPRVDFQAFTGRERTETPSRPETDFTHPGLSVQVRQLLFDGFATSSNITRLDQAALARHQELLGAADNLALEAGRAHADVLRYRELSRLAQDNWAVHKEIHDQIEERARSGVGRRVDLEQAGGRLALAQSNWLTETANLHDVSARYQRYVGNTPSELEPAPVSIAAQLPTETEVLAQAIRDNPGFLAAVANLRAARADADVQRGSYWPTLELRASHSRERNQDGFSGNYSDSAAQVVLNYNLYRGGGDQARVRQAQERYYAAQDLRDQTCRELRQNAAIAFNDIRRLREQLQYLEQHALSTEKARDAYRQQFDIGQRSLLDVLDTENELFEARRSLSNARYDLLVAQLRVLAQTHRLLPALKLAPVRTELAPPADDPGAGEVDDAVLACDTRMAPVAVLDTAAAQASRPPRTPAGRQPGASAVPGATEQQLESMVRDWAAAWSARDADRYLDFYSPDFTGSEADARVWRKLRSERLRRSDALQISIESLRYAPLPDGKWNIGFVQRYRSASYRDDVTKTLTVQRFGSAWKIVQEVSDPL